MDLIQHNLSDILTEKTTEYLIQKTGLSKSALYPALDASIAFILRLIERADTFNYYELANIFTRNGRDTNTPDKIIAALQKGQHHSAMTDARDLLNLLLRDEQESLHTLISNKCQINAKQAEQVLFIGAVVVNILLGRLMINHKLNMRAISRTIKGSANELNEKMSADMREMNRKLVNGNMIFDENKVLSAEKNNPRFIYIGIVIGIFILFTLILKACVE